MHIVGMILILAAFIASIYSTLHYSFYITKGDVTYLKQANKAHSILLYIFIAIGVLLFSLILTHDFSISYVANYSSTKEELMYLISTFWAGQEGTFYLWALYIVIFGSIIIRKNDSFLPYVMIVIHLSVLFILLILLKQSPFRPLDPEIAATIEDGRGLNPLLKNPWMVIHPPMLFMGYTSVIITSAYAIAGLWKNDLTGWMKPALPWTLFTAATLGLGVMMGGYWAYVTLGWGGYWAWDPVENASIFPWFTIVACFHGILLYRGSQSFLKTTTFLAIISYFLMLYGSFLTRSGVIANFSVHSFSSLGLNDFLIAFMIVYLFVALYWFFRRWSGLKSKPLADKFNKEMMLAFVVIIFSLSIFAILIGTSIPLFTMFEFIADKQQAAAQPDQYNTVFSYVAVFLGLFLALGPLFKWKFSKAILPTKDILISSVVSVLVAFVVYSAEPALKLQYYGVFLTTTFAILINGFIYGRSKHSKILQASSVSHIGFGLILFGVMTSSALAKTDRLLLVQNTPYQYKDMTFLYTKYYEDPKDINFKHYLFDVKGPAKTQSITLSTEYSEYNNGIMSRPHLDYFWDKDFYYTFVNAYQYPQGEHRVLKAGETLDIDGKELKFLGFNVLEMNPQKSIFRINADFKYTVDGKSEYITTLFEQLRGENHSKIEAVEALGIHFKVMKVNATNRSLDFVYNDIDKPLIIEQLAIELSEKPFIIILWIGVLVLVGGVLLAMRVRFSQTRTNEGSKENVTEEAVSV